MSNDTCGKNNVDPWVSCNTEVDESLSDDHLTADGHLTVDDRPGCAPTASDGSTHTAAHTCSTSHAPAIDRGERPAVFALAKRTASIAGGRLRAAAAALDDLVAGLQAEPDESRARDDVLSNFMAWWREITGVAGADVPPLSLLDTRSPPLCESAVVALTVFASQAAQIHAHDDLAALAEAVVDTGLAACFVGHAMASHGQPGDGSMDDGCPDDRHPADGHPTGSGGHPTGSGDHPTGSGSYPMTDL